MRRDNSYLTFARTITRRARVRQLTIDSYQLTIVFTNSPRKRNVGAAGSPKQLAFWGALQYVVKVVVLKKEMVLSTTFALAQRHERRGRGNYNDNTDNYSASPTLLSG